MAKDKDIDTKTVDNARELAKIFEKIYSTKKATIDLDDEIVDYAAKYLENIKAGEDTLKEINERINERSDIENKILKAEQAGDELGKKLLDRQKQSLDLQIEHASNLVEQYRTQAQIYDLDEQGIKQRKEQLALEEQRQKIAEKYSDEVKNQLGFLDSIDDVIKDIPVVGGVLSKALGVEDLKKKLTKDISDNFVSGMAKAGEAGGGAFSTLITMARAFTTVLMANPIFLIAAVVVAIIAVFKKLIDVAVEMDKHTTEIANNLNMSKHAAHDLEAEMVKNGVSIEKVVHFSKILGDQFGEYGAKIAKDVIPRMKQMQMNLQLTDDEMGNITQAALSVGSSLQGTNNAASDFETTALNVTKQFYEQRGIQLDNAELQDEYRKNLQDIGKIEKRNLALYGKSGQALVNQVMTVRKLGLSFDQVTKIMDATLEIDQSIGNEMEANVLLGKNLNLNAVRYASLYGSVEDVARETVKSLEDQNINLDTFNDMTGFQKKQLEKVYGLSADEIQNMLLKNKLQDQSLLDSIKDNKISAEDLATKGKITKEEAQQLIQQESKASMAESYEDIQAQLTSSIKANLPGIQSLINVLSDFGQRAAQVGILGAVFGGGESIKESETPKPATEMHDGVIGPGGKMVVSSPAGAISLNPNDSIVAGTNLFGGGTQTNTATDNTDLISIIKEQNALLKQLVAATSGPTVIKIGNKTIEELDSQISLRKNYNIGPDRTYGNRL